MRRIVVGSDHAGFELKEYIKKHVEELGYPVTDCGTYTTDRADYPVYGEKAGRIVAAGECDLGIVVCGTGCGISLSANQVKGIRCCNCSEPYTARMSRCHNNANMLALGARVVGFDLALMIVDAFLEAEFESGGRHEDRVNMIMSIDRS